MASPSTSGCTSTSSRAIIEPETTTLCTISERPALVTVTEGPADGAAAGAGVWAWAGARPATSSDRAAMRASLADMRESSC